MPIVLALQCGDVPSPDFLVHTFLPAIRTVSFYLLNATLLSVPAGAWINMALSRMVRGLEANLIAVSTNLLSQFNFVSIDTHLFHYRTSFAEEWPYELIR